MKIAITGAAGWLGRYVTDALADAGHEPVLVDHVDPDRATVFDPDAASGRRVVPLAPAWPYHRVSIDDATAIRAALDGVERIVHLAARPTGDWAGAEETMQTNVMGTFTLLRAAVDLGVGRVVNASSINAFGTFYWRVSGRAPVRRTLPLEETDPPVPEDPYSVSKLITEQLTATFTRAFGLETANLRFAGVYPEQRYERLLTDGLPPTTAWADDLFQWVHVRDVCDGIVRAVLAEQVTPDPIVLGAADTRAPEPTLELITRFRPDLLGDLHRPLPGRSPLLSIDRARTVLGYHPRFTFADALDR